MSVSWPMPFKAETQDGGFDQIFVNVASDYGRDYFRGQYGICRVDLSSEQLTCVPKPAPEGKLAGFVPQTGAILLKSETQDGTYIWAAFPDSFKPYALVEANTFLRGIAQGERKKIKYTSLDGRELTGWVILPAGYEAGKRYPLVTDVYPGATYGDSPPLGSALEDNIWLSFQLLAAHGYAVLVASMPLQRMQPQIPSDQYLELANGALPAVDRVIDMGVADPKRLGLIGHSHGGYAVYGLITQTKRFQAAVSMAGYSDATSLYGEPDVKSRYGCCPLDDLSMMGAFETGPQGPMYNPPWKDMERYIRNSPLSYVEHVQTPLLIIQGDMDHVSIQQGEEFFGALYRQNKRARFVRYWGEAHFIEGPANVRDMWKQIYAWFDEFLKADRN